MIKQLIFLVAFASAFGCSSYAQTPFLFSVSGLVTDCSSKSPLEGVTVKLVGSDGQWVEVKTNEKGEYILNSSAKKSPFACIIKTYGQYSYFSFSTSVQKFMFYDSCKTNNGIADFCLTKGCTMHYLPTFLFKKNSSGDYYEEDTLNGISQLYYTLMDNPTYVVELGGNANPNEKDPVKLAQARADEIRNALIKQGIEPERLVAKSYGDTRPREEKDENGKVISIDRKSDRNRRVYITILRKYYIPAKPGTVAPAPKKASEEEEE
ncbi:MAG: OmpA/MotB domain protein [Bacteroidetes bacterium]|nr:OmpA/MotB domain protein [Bacteroidota bacterium]